jgi:hypothetical protein
VRGLLFLIVIILVYYALKTIVRSAVRSYYEEEPKRKQVKGEDMVLCSECRTYVVKDRSATRRIRGAVHSFCSEACADRYEKKHNG